MPCGRFGGGGGHVPLLSPLGPALGSKNNAVTL